MEEGIAITLKEEAKDGALRVTARIEWQKQGRTVTSYASGVGANRADAVGNLAKDKMPKKLRSALIKVLEHKNPDMGTNARVMDGADPKDVQPHVAPDASGQEEAPAETPSTPTTTKATSSSSPTSESKEPAQDPEVQSPQDSQPTEGKQGTQEPSKPDGTEQEPKSSPDEPDAF